MTTKSKICGIAAIMVGLFSVAFGQITSVGTSGTTAGSGRDGGSGGVMLGTGPDAQPTRSIIDEAAAGRRTTTTSVETTTEQTTKSSSKSKKRASRAASKASPSPRASASETSAHGGR